MSQLITKNASLPSKLLDAHFLEQQAGDGRLGSSDFAEFYAPTVDPADLPAWRSVLVPMQPQNTPAYEAPKQPTQWRLAQDEFVNLQFYDPKYLQEEATGGLVLTPTKEKFSFMCSPCSAARVLGALQGSMHHACPMFGGGESAPHVRSSFENERYYPSTGMQSGEQIKVSSQFIQAAAASRFD